MIKPIIDYLQTLQDRICAALAEEDGHTVFTEKTWEHTHGGRGRSRVLTHGAVIEKGGVNFSYVQGNQLPPKATERRHDLAGYSFQATGVSLVIHPLNPYAPTSHANIRFFMAEKPDTEVLWWFGGGFDLTPYYGFEEDAIHWHTTAKKACDPFGATRYPTYKKSCDDYFYLPHRQEPRGIGGIFFDDLNEGGFEQCFSFMRSIGDHYLMAYQPILARRKNQPYGARERRFQQYRRGRYVEFNLLYDRGTAFGLQSNGNTEAILMSLPPEAQWIYDWQPEPNTPEAALYTDFLVAKDWV